MEEIIEDIVKTVKALASVVIGSGEAFHPILTTIKNGEEHLRIVSPWFDEEGKAFIYSQMFVAANLDEPEAIVWASDSMTLKVEEDETWERGISPTESPFAVHALMFLMAIPEGLRTLLSFYSINDDGSITFTEDEAVSNLDGSLSSLMEAAMLLEIDSVDPDYASKLHRFMEQQGFSIVVADS